MQGFGKIFTYGVDQLYTMFFLESFKDSILPEWMLLCTAYFTSYAEAICGLTVMLGLMRYLSYTVLATVLFVVSFGHGLIEPIWNLEHVLFRGILLLPLFFIDGNEDRFSLDHLISTKNE